MKIASFALALEIIIRIDRAVASFPTRPNFTTPNEDEDASASASVFASSALNFTAMTKEELIENFISHNGEVEFSNITASPHYGHCTRYFTGGYGVGYAYENDGNTTLTDVHLLPDEGIMLSSGNPLDFEWNDSDGQTTFWGLGLGLDLSDADLVNVTNTTYGIYDACFIEFDFKCSKKLQRRQYPSNTCLDLMNMMSMPTVLLTTHLLSFERREYCKTPFE
jgi:hypothetical protein